MASGNADGQLGRFDLEMTQFTALEAPILTSKNDVMMQAVCKLFCPFSIFPMAIKTPKGSLEGMDGLT